MLKFIQSGNYLRRTGVFFNRYLSGLLCIWVVVFSGMVAITSLVAWTFRWLDHPRSRDLLSALTFDGDIRLALFPSFVLFVLWLLMWGISYFKHGPRATGGAARIIFYLLFVVTLTAIAAMVGTGDLSVGSLLQDFGFNLGPETIAKVQTALQTLIFSVIGASLIPYLSPKRLLRSGMAGQSTFERITFWVASRALVIGVPFLFVAFFARENISLWNERRDDRITITEITWDATSPVWDIHRDIGNLWRDQEQHVATPDSIEWWWQLGSNNSDTSRARQLESTWQVYDKAEQSRAAYGLASRRYENGPPVPGDFSQQSWPEDDVMTFAERWWHTVQFLGSTLGLGDQEDNPIYQMAQSSNSSRKTRQEITHQLFERMQEPTFYRAFLPEKYFGDSLQQIDLLSKPVRQAFDLVRQESSASASGTEKSTDPSEHAKNWYENLVALRRHAEKACEAHRSARDLILAELTTNPETGSSSGRNEDELLAATAKDRYRREVLKINRQLLSAFYGDKVIKDKKTVFAANVLYADQQTRLQWIFWSAVVFVVSGLLVDMNATSWHGFYSQRISEMWIEEVPGIGRSIPLAQLSTTDTGRPYHLIGATLNLTGRRTSDFTGRGRDYFLFSQCYCGSESTGYVATAEYGMGKHALDDAIAASGGAVSPMYTSNPLVKTLLFLGNVRLGHWVANPSHAPLLSAGLRQLTAFWPVTPLSALVGQLRNANRRPHCFVSDGGHYENLGIEQLLARRCRLILAVDATHDEDFNFADFARLVRWAEARHGVRFVQLADDSQAVDLSHVTPSDKQQKVADKSNPPAGSVKAFARKHAFVGRILYPDDQVGYLVYLKSTMTGDEPLQLLRFYEQNDEFPHDSSADQFFNADRFESYRQLGFHSVDSICDSLPADLGRRASEVSTSQFIAMFTGTPQQPPRDADVDALITTLLDKHADPAEREQIALELARTNSDDASVVVGLIEGLASRDALLVKTCGLALQSMAARAIPNLRDHGLTHKSPKVRAAVANVLAEIFSEAREVDEQTIDALVVMFQSAKCNSTERQAALSALQTFCVALGRQDGQQALAKRVRHQIATSPGVNTLPGKTRKQAAE